LWHNGIALLLQQREIDQCRKAWLYILIYIPSGIDAPCFRRLVTNIKSYPIVGELTQQFYVRIGFAHSIAIPLFVEHHECSRAVNNADKANIFSRYNVRAEQI